MAGIGADIFSPIAGNGFHLAPGFLRADRHHDAIILIHAYLGSREKPRERTGKQSRKIGLPSLQNLPPRGKRHVP